MKLRRILPAAFVLCCGLMLAAIPCQAQSLTYNQANQTISGTYDPSGLPAGNYGLQFTLTATQGLTGTMTSFNGGGGTPGAVIDSFNAVGALPSVTLAPGMDQLAFLVQQFTFGASPISFSFQFAGMVGTSPQADNFSFDVLDLDNNFASVAFASQDLQPTAVPEPTTLLLVGISLSGVAAAAFKRRRASVDSDT